MHHGDCCEAEELSVSLIFVHVRCTQIWSAFELEEKNERFELAVTRLHIQREAGQRSSAHFSGSSSFFVAISNGLQLIYEIVM